MSAAAAVVLSSSPPRTFARSPTSIGSSPSLPSPSELFKFGCKNRTHFQPTKKPRDGFSTGSKSARSLLGTKKGAENVPVRSPGRKNLDNSVPVAAGHGPRFTLSQVESHAPSELPSDGPSVLQREEPVNRHQDLPSPSLDVAREWTATEKRRSACIQEASRHTVSTFRAHGEKAIPRRTDWTPPKERQTDLGDGPGSAMLERAKTLPTDILRSFSFEGDPSETMRPRQSLAVSNGTTKRQRIELVAGTVESPGFRTKIVDPVVTEKPVVKKLNKLPAKKSMTITGLATSHYFGQDKHQKESPMMQYLSATRTRTLHDDFDESASSDQVAKPSKQKQKPQKQHRQRSKLMSPQSAMKAMEAQEAVFGSASQLALEAEAGSSPQDESVWTQQTQPISIESTTPQTSRGTSRFVKARNLWGVAARDDDNALLHVDSVDLFDTPGVRVAFAGKDVLLEHHSGVDNRSSFPKAARHNVPDVEDFDSPLLRPQPLMLHPPLSRSFHISASTRSTTKTSKYTMSLTQKKQGCEIETTKTTVPEPSRSAPKRPTYAGFTTHDLQKQLSSFGFKPVKKREKMIELLEKCWEEKYGKDDSAIKHGDFLTKVHDVSCRPQPRVTKPRKSAKDNNIEGETCPQKKPRKRGKDDKVEDEALPPKAAKRPKMTPHADNEQEAPKKARKRKSKALVGPEAKVMDIDEVESPRIPARGEKVADIGGEIHNITPSPSRPAQAAVEKQNLSTREVEIPSTNIQKGIATAAFTPPPSRDVLIGHKIQAAILRQSEDGDGADRNHQQEPTWHERILQYDPLILEDLTVWLNTWGLNLVDEDREVSPIEVRDWCETNSICCLWKGGWRGNKVKRAEDRV